MARHLFIVSRHHPKLYDYLLERFHDDDNVAIILDRRTGERRGRAAESPQPAPRGEERRGEDRRRPIPPDDSLGIRSHLIVTLDET